MLARCVQFTAPAGVLVLSSKEALGLFSECPDLDRIREVVERCGKFPLETKPGVRAPLLRFSSRCQLRGMCQFHDADRVLLTLGCCSCCCCLLLSQANHWVIHPAARCDISRRLQEILVEPPKRSGIAPFTFWMRAQDLEVNTSKHWLSERQFHYHIIAVKDVQGDTVTLVLAGT